MMCEDQKMLLQRIRELDFACIDCGLYLDAYPCKEACQYYRNTAEECAKLKEKYCEKYGPLTMKDSGANGKWDWAVTPMPWESEAN